MTKGPKIKITIQPIVDNVIQFHDALKGAAAQLNEIADNALMNGDHEDLKGTHQTVSALNDDADDVGDIFIGD